MKQKKYIILAGMMGNFIETFDMALCGLLSIFLAKYFMNDANKGMWIIFLTFFAGYLIRPIGAIVLGLLSDTYGRKITLSASILSMGISTALIGIIPSYHSIGVMAPILLLILRIIQSFSCGAEYLNTSAYLTENADHARKGFSSSWAAFGAMAGLLFASLITWCVTLLIFIYPKYEWIIWRMPFVFALLGSTIGLYVRLLAPESSEYTSYLAENPRPALKNIFIESWQYLRTNKFKAFHAFTLSLLGITTIFQIYIYGPAQAHLYSLFTDNQIVSSNTVSLIVLLCIFPIAGKLSDHINREKIIIAASLGFFLFIPPFFYCLWHGNYLTLILMQALIAIPAATYHATLPVVLTEMFPIQLRCTALSALYTTAASLAAGFTPLLSFLMLNKTYYSISPSMIVITLIGLLMIGVKFNSSTKD